MTTDKEEPEIMGDGDAQMSLTNLEGDLDDINQLIDDKDYVKALEAVDDAIEKIQIIRRYLTGKVE